GYGYPPAPQKSKTGLIAVVVAAVVILGLVVGLLIWQPWTSDDQISAPGGGGQEFAIDRGIVLTVKVPDGWRAETMDYDGERGLIMVPASEGSPGASIVDGFRQGQVGADTHGVFASAGECRSGSGTPKAVGQWSAEPSMDLPEVAFTVATLRVDDADCLEVVGIDGTSGRAAGDWVSSASTQDTSLLTARKH
ncbi:MAG: hypothetical protein WAW85_12755, partial [Gordonia sp. (in: high G+C Gram-positive bacteria)]|uniref:hypothetical protein n=1 Tax=Gordonia sp. (in: high G+C Gram-positive bacteria) TaxID=84139 RepID=UPI003BB706FC